MITVGKIKRFVGKSMQGEELDRAEIVKTGIRYDRMVALVSVDGANNRKLISQRTPGCQMLALVKARVDETSRLIHFAFPGGAAASVPMDMGANLPAEKLESFDLHGDPVLGIDCGDEVAYAFQNYLNAGRQLSSISCRLMLLPPQAPRLISKAHADFPRWPVSYADKVHILAIGKMDEFNNIAAGKLDPKAVPLKEDSLRANLKLKGLRPYGEDFIGRVRIGRDVVLDFRRSAERCSIITVDQDTGEIYNPLAVKLLAQVRSERTGEQVPLLGALAVVETPGWIQTGDKVEILSWRSLPEVVAGMDDGQRDAFYARHGIWPASRPDLP